MPAQHRPPVQKAINRWHRHMRISILHKHLLVSSVMQQLLYHQNICYFNQFVCWVLKSKVNGLHLQDNYFCKMIASFSMFFQLAFVWNVAHIHLYNTIEGAITSRLSVRDYSPPCKIKNPFLFSFLQVLDTPSGPWLLPLMQLGSISFHWE